MPSRKPKRQGHPHQLARPETNPKTLVLAKLRPGETRAESLGSIIVPGLS
jgi:hypothetical protein